MMRSILILLCVCIAGVLFAQDDTYKDKEYDKMIFMFQMEQVQQASIDKTTYLNYTKPFSKWDPRPLKDSLVWVMNEKQPASRIPNFFWGTFSNYYGQSIKQAQALPNTFLKGAYKNESKLIKYFKGNEAKFSKLTDALANSDHSIYLNLNGLQRVDNLYNESGVYWEYMIPENSPFPLSDSLVTNLTENYGESDKAILDLIGELNIYSVFKYNDLIYFLSDGVLDNSYGYVHHSAESKIRSNHLFDISKVTKIKPNYSFYVAR